MVDWMASRLNANILVDRLRKYYAYLPQTRIWAEKDDGNWVVRSNLIFKVPPG